MRADPNKSVQIGSLIKSKYRVHARLFGTLEYQGVEYVLQNSCYFFL